MLTFRMIISQILAVVILGTNITAYAAETLPLPRFASLRSKEVNARVGPGKHYPIEWTFVRSQMPIEIVAEFYTWRKIRDWQGTEGWIHKSMLSGTRTAVIKDTTQTCYSNPSKESSPLARAEAGVIVKLNKCDPTWCRVQADGHKCWIERKHIWGVYPNEKLD